MDIATLGTIIGILLTVVGLVVAVVQGIIGYRDYQLNKAKEIKEIPPEETNGLGVLEDKKLPSPILKHQVFLIPRRPQPFVNREEQIKKIEEELRAYKIVQLQDLGGIGKTVLAIEVAHRLKDHFPDGIVHISSIDYPDLEDILNAIANAFDINIEQTPLREKKAKIQKEFQSKRLLLVFDNVEEFEPIEEVKHILPDSALLITCRPPKLIAGAIPIELGPLPQEHAINLFELNTGLSLSVEQRKTAESIVTNLGSYPLAIEIAAKHILLSRGGFESLDKIIKEVSSLKTLDEKFLEDRSVRTSFIPTYRSLSSYHKKIFMSLGTFGGSSFSLDAVKKVIISENKIAEEGINRLVALKLVNVADDRRYSLHPVLKMFAQDYISSTEPYKRMAEYFCKFAEENSEDYDALEIERSNIQEAINWSYRNGEHTLVIKIVQALLGKERDYGFLTQRGHWNDAVVRIDQAIKASAELKQTDTEANFLLARGLFHYWFGNYDEARQVYGIAQERFTQTNNERGLVRVYLLIGYIEDDEDNYAMAEELYRKGLKLSIEIGDPILIETARELVGVVLYHRGKYIEAQAELEKSLKESMSRSDSAAIARNKRRLGSVALRLADSNSQTDSQLYIEKARSLFNSALEIERNRRSIARIKRQIGMLELFLGNSTIASKYFSESLNTFKSLGNRKGIAATLYNIGIVLESNGKLDEAEKHYSESLEIGKDMNMRSGPALNLLQLASIEYKRKNFENALNLANQAVDILVSIDSLHVERAQKLLDTIQKDCPKR